MEKQSPWRRAVEKMAAGGLSQRSTTALKGLLGGDPSATKRVLWMIGSWQRLESQAVFISELFWLGGRWESRFSLNLSRSWK